MPLHTFTFLIGVSLLIGCQTGRHPSPVFPEPREALLLDEQTFAKILNYYRKTFPTTTFIAGHFIHMSDGPNGERLRIDVPIAVEAEYLHPYAPAFLAKQKTSTDGLAQTIAGDLLLLRRERLYTRPSRVSYDGKNTVDCITYVVKSDKSSHSEK
jgi:hypothetical protein